MKRFDRYLLSQFLVLFGFFSLILVAVYWVNRAVNLFDQLIADGQTATVFLEFTVLTLPNVVLLVLPISAFVAGTYVTNRLIGESEIVVLRGAGVSTPRMARGALAFGLVVGVLVALLANALVPASRAELARRSDEIAADVTARFIRPGEFQHVGKNVTIFVSEVSDAGEIRGLFLHDRRDPGIDVTYTASRALLVDTPEGPRLVMFDGLAQTLARDDDRMTALSFADLSLDLGTLVETRAAHRTDPRQLGTLRLMAADEATAELTGAPRAQLLFEAHQRIARPLLAVFMPLVGVLALLGAPFSRFGSTRQIFLAVGIVIGLQVFESAMADLAASSAGGWPLVYMPPAVAAVIVAVLALWADRRLPAPRRMAA